MKHETLLFQPFDLVTWGWPFVVLAILVYIIYYFIKKRRTPNIKMLIVAASAMGLLNSCKKEPAKEEQPQSTSVSESLNAVASVNGVPVFPSLEMAVQYMKNTLTLTATTTTVKTTSLNGVVTYLTYPATEVPKGSGAGIGLTTDSIPPVGTAVIEENVWLVAHYGVSLSWLQIPPGPLHGGGIYGLDGLTSRMYGLSIGWSWKQNAYTWWNKPGESIIHFEVQGTQSMNFLINQIFAVGEFNVKLEGTYDVITRKYTIQHWYNSGGKP